MLEGPGEGDLEGAGVSGEKRVGSLCPWVSGRQTLSSCPARLWAAVLQLPLSHHSLWVPGERSPVFLLQPAAAPGPLG